MKIVRIIAGCFLVLVAVAAAIFIRDRLYEWRLEKNLQSLSVGMSEEEVIERLGEPTSKYISDISPGIYWCYGWNSFDDNPDYCGKALEMSGPPRKLVKIL